MRAVLFYTIGLPGTGKTTLANNLSYWLGARHLRADKIGLELFRFPTFSTQERQAVYAEMARLANEHLAADKTVLYDANANTSQHRTAIVALAKKSGRPAIGLWLELPVEQAKQRAGRIRDQGISGSVARVVPAHIFDQYAAAFEAPTPAEQIVRVAGDAPFALQYRQLQRQLIGHDLGLPRMVQ